MHVPLVGHKASLTLTLLVEGQARMPRAGAEAGSPRMTSSFRPTSGRFCRCVYVAHLGCDDALTARRANTRQVWSPRQVLSLPFGGSWVAPVERRRRREWTGRSL